ncbi:fMet-Leu-Phe receptor [Biomphalaria glabrata]|nr:fMet-Leu-Phe receptor-like [Biomphalaria glabrata]
MDHIESIYTLTSADILITDEEYVVIESILCAARGALAVLGVFGNILNIQTFMSMGLKDGLSISFTFLAFSDILYLSTVIARAVSFVFTTLETRSSFQTLFPIEPYGLYIFTGHAGRLPYVLSNLTTTFLAVARCLCVARPLQFKTRFSRKTTVMILFLFFCFSLASYLPVTTFMGISLQYFSNLNVTREALWVSSNTEWMDILWAIRDAFIPFASQLIIFLCFIIMANCLRASHSFRRKHDLKYSNKPTICTTNCVISGFGNGNRTKNFSRKDIQIVRQISLICVVYVVCNTPTVLINLARVYVPQFTLEKLYHNVYYTATGFKHLFQTVNASFTIIIYLTYNTKFRQTQSNRCFA